MDDLPTDMPDEPANLRLLRRLVTALMVVMIAGIVMVVALMVYRLNTLPSASTGSLPPLPDGIALPPDTRATAITRGDGWFAIVTQQQQILIFDADGTLRQTVEIDLP